MLILFSSCLFTSLRPKSRRERERAERAERAQRAAPAQEERKPRKESREEAELRKPLKEIKIEEVCALRDLSRDFWHRDGIVCSGFPQALTSTGHIMPALRTHA